MLRISLHAEGWQRGEDVSLLQTALRAGTETPESLLAKYAIKSKPHGLYPALLMMKYDQIASNFAEPMVREARGIIFAREDNWRVVARPFDKFFNHGDPMAAVIDWPSARVQEKLDGSLM